MVRDPVQERDVDRTDASPENDRSPPSQVAGKIPEGSNYSNPKEEMEDEMCDVMRRLFAENDTLDEI